MGGIINGGNDLGSSSGAEMTSNSFRTQNGATGKCYAKFESVSNVTVRYKGAYGWNDYTNEQIQSSGNIVRYWTFQ